LLDGLQNGTHRGKEGAADQSAHERMRLATAWKAETSRMKNISTESSGRGKNVFGLRKIAYSQKNSLIIIIIIKSIENMSI
jgi:hypothetical protein